MRPTSRPTSWPALLFLAFLALSPVLAAPAQAEPVAVGGKVLDGRGKPLAKATVQLLPEVTHYERNRLRTQAKAGPEPAVTAATDAAGKFRITAPAPGLWRVRVEARGFAPRELTLHPLLEETELPEARLEAAASLKVQVTAAGPAGDAAKRPLAGAQVLAVADYRAVRSRALFDPWRAAERSGITGADGTVTLLKEAKETLRIQAAAPGHLLAETSTAKAQGTAIWINLSRAACAVPVEVVDRERKPVADVLVGVDRLTLATTDAAGRATLSTACGQEARLQASLRDGRRIEAALAAKRAQGEAVRLILPPQPLQLTGRVMEEGSRQPLAGAWVWSNREPGRAVQTGRDGGYTLVVPPREDLMLSAASPRHLLGTADQKRSAADGGAQGGPAFALSPTALAAGTVVDAGGRPVPDAQIVAAAAGRPDFFQGGPPAQTRSGDRGTFRLRVSPGQTYDLKVRHAAFAPASVPLAEIAPHGTRPDLRIVLQSGHKATGTVLDFQERPVAGARIVLRPAAEAGPGRPMFPRFGGEEQAFEALSGADGRFAFDHLPAGRFDLRAQAAGFGPVVVPGLEVRAAANPVSLGTVILQPGVELAGLVLDNQNQPIPGAKVQVFPDGLPRFAPGADDEQMETATAADGTFTFTGLGTGSRMQVSVTQEGYAARTVQGVELPLAQPLRIVLPPGSRVAGRTVDERGQPVSRALVRVSRTGTGNSRGFSMPLRSVVTDESGRFEVENLEAGAVTVSANAPGLRPTEIANLELAPGKDLDDLELVMRAGAVVAGQVVGPDGKPVAGAQVEVERSTPGGVFLPPARSDGDGRYRLEGLEPGPRVLAATHSSHPKAVKDLDVQAGENRLDFQLGGGHDVSGRVVDSAGQPVEGATLLLQFADWRNLPQARSGADGGFRFPGVGEGVYALSAERQGYASARMPEVRVAGPVGGLEVRLDRGGAIRGRLIGIDFSQLGQVMIMAGPVGAGPGGMAQGRADFQMEYRVDGVAAGEWHVIGYMAQDGRRAEGKVQVETGGEAVLDLDFSEKDGLTLSGRVVRGGGPRTGVQVYVEGIQTRSSGSGQTNQDGAFRVSGLEPGSYTVSVMGFGSGISHQETVELTADRDIVIELPESRVSGRVVDAADSSAVEGATVTLEPLEPAPDAAGSRFLGSRTSTSDTTGAFAVSDVGEGSYRVVARKEGYGPAETTVQIGSGQSVEGVRLTLSATQGLTLQVAGPAGSLSSVDLALLDGSGRVVLAGRYPVAEGGRVRLSDAPPGRWSLLVASPGTATASLEVTAPGPPTAVALPPAIPLQVNVPDLEGSTLRATVTAQGANGRPYQTLGWNGTLAQQWAVYDGGTWLELPPGTWKVVVTAPDGRSWQGTATTSPGAPGEVTLR